MMPECRLEIKYFAYFLEGSRLETRFRLLISYSLKLACILMENRTICG